jgi:hypothetical protein
VHRRGELRPRVELAAFNLDKFRDRLATHTLEVGGNGFPLRLQAEPASIQKNFFGVIERADMKFALGPRALELVGFAQYGDQLL